MAGNSIGQVFRVTTFGESHGLALGCIVDGVPPGIELKALYSVAVVSPAAAASAAAWARAA